MKLRDQIRSRRRPWGICAITGAVMLVPPALVALQMKLVPSQPPDYWPLLVILTLAAGGLLIVGRIGPWSVRCPKCQGSFGVSDQTNDKCCRHCGADFDAEV